MSIKKGKYGNIEDVTIVEFGFGTISIVNGKADKHKSLFIKQKEFSPIGEKGEFKSNSDEFEPQIAIVFHNKESFDVFKEYVDNIERQFTEEQVK